MIDNLQIAQCYLYYNGDTLINGNLESNVESGSNSIFNNIIIQTTNGYVFSGENYNIYQLGIQSKPGLKINLANNGTIIIGQTGIFELNLSALKPLKGSIAIKNMEIIKGNTTDSNGNFENCNYCLIDVIYAKNSDKGDEETV